MSHYIKIKTCNSYHGTSSSTWSISSSSAPTALQPYSQNISKEEEITHRTGADVAVLLPPSEMNKRERFRTKGTLQVYNLAYTRMEGAGSEDCFALYS
jgi:hypothetical protein